MTKPTNEILFEPFPKQIEFLESIFSWKYSFILYGGSIRGGKTFAGIGALLLLSKMFPGSRWAIVRDNLQTLKRNTIPSFKKIVPKSYIQKYNQDTQTVTFTNGSEILFFAENYDQDKELNRWKGLEINGFLLEEINELQRVSFHKAIERAGSHIIPGTDNQPKPLIIGTCNPAHNWIRDDIYFPWKHGTLNPAWKYIPAKIFDNPYISAEYIDSLSNMPSYEYDVFVNGNWEIELKTGGEYYKSFDMDRHTGSFEYDPSKPIHVSFDENVNPYITAVVWQIHGDDSNDLRQIDEYCFASPNNTVRKLCDAIKSDYHGHTSGLFIYGDATSKKADTKLERGHNFFTLIRDHLESFKPTLRVPMSNPSVVMRGNFINQIWDKGFQDITIRVDRECKFSIADFNNVKEDPDGKKSKKKTRDNITGISYEQYGHTSDASDYFIIEALKRQFNEYSTGRQTFDHVIIGSKQRTKNTY